MSDLEFQAASLSLREWALWVAIVQVGISAAQTGIVYYGIRAMIRAADQRGRDAERDRTERAEAAADARREADQRHAEAMQAAADARREAAEAAEAARREAADARREAADARREAAEAAEAARREAADARREAAEAAEAARREADRRHAEVMQAGAERHAENMATIEAQSRALDALIEGHRAQIASLETLIGRTAPAPSHANR